MPIKNKDLSLKSQEVVRIKKKLVLDAMRLLHYSARMRKNYFKILLSIFIFSYFVPLSFAKLLEVNTQHSQIHFDIDYLSISKVRGSFKKFIGTFEYNEASNTFNNIQVVVDANSIDTSDKKRDLHLRRKDFFYVKKYPAIKFMSHKVYYKNNEPTRIDGYLEMLGLNKPVSFDVSFKGFKSDPFRKNYKSLFLVASTEINRKDWGLSWNRLLDEGGLLLGDKVRISFTVEATPTDKKPAYSRFFIPEKKNSL